MLCALALAAALRAPQDAPPPVRIEAQDVDYRLKEGKTVMTGNPRVTLTRGDAVLTCRRLVLDNDARGKVQRATCEGDVRLVRGGRVVTCQSAVYEYEAARIVCRGTPTLVDGHSEMTGEELIYDLDEDRVRLTKGKGTLRDMAVPAPKREAKK